MDSLGKIVRTARKKKGDDIKKMAKTVKCSEAFARHIESSKSVPVSQRLADALIAKYKIPRTKLMRALAARNRVGRAYYSAYNKRANA